MASTAITGAAGAYLVAGELSLLGWVASLTWGNAPRTDILAQRLDPPLTAAFQVKTKTTGDFQVGMDAEKVAPPGSNEWYVLASLNKAGARPDYFILPRNHMAALIYIGYRAWLAGTNPHGRPRKEGTRRAFNAGEFASYHEQWDLLDAPADDAPWLLPQWVWDQHHAGHGLPEGHPGLGERTELQ